MRIITQILPYIQIALSILLVALVLMQYSETDLGGSFGGSDTTSSGARTRRGLEKAIYTATIVVVILFVASAIVALILSN